MSLTSLTTIQNSLNYYGYPLILTLGNIGNLFIFIIFSRQQHNACSFYVLSLAIVNNIYLTFNCLTRMLSYSFISSSLAAFAYCKIRYYISGTFGQVAKTIIVLACIDRYMMTHIYINFRACSTLKRAKIMVFISFIFWLIAGCHIPILVTINNGLCTVFGIYAVYFSIYVLLAIGILPPTISAIFGYLTYRNLKFRRVRIQPRIRHTNKITRRERGLLILVMSEVILYIVTTTLYPITLTEISLSRYYMSNKSHQHIVIENFIFTLSIIFVYINHGASFYMYLISSKSFRRDFKRLVINCYRKLRRLPLTELSR